MAFPSVDEARRFLADHYGAAIDRIEIIGEGAWSRGFAFAVGGEDLVARFGAQLEDFEKDRVASSFSSPALPVPEMLEVGEALGAFVAVSRRASGEFLEALSPQGILDVAPALFAAFEAIRSVDISHTTGFGEWGADGTAPHATWRDAMLSAAVDDPGHRTAGWSRRLAEDPPAQRLFDECIRRIDELADATPADVRSLVHADFINRNVLVEGDRLTAVFDWGCSLYGDFLFEIAWIENWSPWYAGLDAFPLREVARGWFEGHGIDVPDLDARMRCAALHIGASGLAYRAFQGDHSDRHLIMARIEQYLDD